MKLTDLRIGWCYYLEENDDSTVLRVKSFHRDGDGKDDGIRMEAIRINPRGNSYTPVGCYLEEFRGIYTIREATKLEIAWLNSCVEGEPVPDRPTGFKVGDKVVMDRHMYLIDNFKENYLYYGTVIEVDEGKRPSEQTVHVRIANEWIEGTHKGQDYDTYWYREEQLRIPSKHQMAKINAIENPVPVEIYVTAGMRVGNIYKTWTDGEEYISKIAKISGNEIQDEYYISDNKYVDNTDYKEGLAEISEYGEATDNEIEWLNLCISEGCTMSRPEVVKPPTPSDLGEDIFADKDMSPFPVGALRERLGELELLEQAKKDYPVGTRYHPAHLTMPSCGIEKYLQIVHKDQEFMIDGGDIYLNNPDGNRSMHDGNGESKSWSQYLRNVSSGSNGSREVTWAEVYSGVESKPTLGLFEPLKAKEYKLPKKITITAPNHNSEQSNEIVWQGFTKPPYKSDVNEGDGIMVLQSASDTEVYKVSEEVDGHRFTSIVDPASGEIHLCKDKISEEDIDFEELHTATLHDYAKGVPETTTKEESELEETPLKFL